MSVDFRSGSARIARAALEDRGPEGGPDRGVDQVFLPS